MSKNYETNFVRFLKIVLYLLVYLVHICTFCYQELLNHLRVLNIIKLIIVGIFVVNW